MASASQPQMDNPCNSSLFQTLCHLFVLFLSLPLSAMAAQGSTLEITRGPENITVATESEAALHCEVNGFPVPVVHWFKNNKLVQNNHHRSLHNSGRILFFKNVSEEDEGFYFCEAKNEKEMLRSQMAFLLPAVMEWNFILQPSNVTVLREDSVTLTCRPPRSKPPAQVSWFKNSRLINPMPHISQQPNGDLLFHRVLEKDRGIYFCRASNSHLFRAVSSRKVYMNVLGPPSLEVRPAMVTAPLGSEVRFQCQVSGNPPPSITWSKQGWTVLTGGKVTIGARNATLYLSSVKSYDEGLYTCEASNVMGRARGTASLHMAAEADPEDQKAEGEGAVPTGNNRTEQKRQEQHLIGALEPSISLSPVTKLLLGYSTVPSSESVALKGSLGKENRVPPAAQNLLLVMESRPFLLPSLDAVWTPTGLGDSLKNLEEFVIETEKALVTEAFSVPQHTQIKASQSSSDAVMPTIGADAELSTTQLVTGSQYLSPDQYFSPSNFHLSPSDNNEFYPHMLYSASGETPTFIYQSQALFPEPQSQPPDRHSQPPGHDSQLHSFSMSEGDWVPISTAKELNKNQPTFPAGNDELHPTNCPKSNMSQPLLTNSDGTKSERPKSWLAALEKHDIPIVVGVGVSLIFIFITMAFYSLVQKNEPAPTGRPAQRNLRGHSGHPQTRRTYENRAFESDAVAVTEQNTSTGSTVHLPSTNSITMMMEPSAEILPRVSQLTEDYTTTADPDPESKKHPQDHCAGLESGECQDAHNPKPQGIQASQEEGIHTFLTLQTTEPCGTPNHHSVSISHRSAPFLLSHCVSLGVTTVAVDVHYYPSSSDSSTFMPTAAQVNKGSQLPQSQEYDQTVPKLHYAQRTCL